MKDIKCIHVDMKKYKDRGLYIYPINSKQDLMLCPDCNLNLAGEIARQQAIEVFVHSPCLCSCKVCQDEDKREDEEIFKKSKPKEVKKDVRKRSERGRAKGKESRN